tara:strand:+ start:16 stop:381 length:366 start_codon:yes stop_codon:yes gene_type:complete
MEYKKKRDYIYENIHKVNTHNQLIELMNLNGCKYTQNNNGIFVNLNTLDKEIINKMYLILYNLIDNKESILTSFQEKEDTIKEVLTEIQEKIVEPKIERDVYLNDFSEEEQNIICQSKKYF